MKQIFVYMVIVGLLVIFGACSKDSNPVVTSASPKTFDPVALWDTAGIFPGNIVQCLAATGNFLFAGTSDSGVYRSSNNGSTWGKSNSGLPIRDIRALLAKDSILFAVTYGDGIYRSTDNGSTWNAANSGITGVIYFTSIVQKGTDVFVGSYNGYIFRSTNNGLSWTAAGDIGGQINALVVKENKIYAGTYWSVIHRSTNNGSSWDTINTTSSQFYSLAVKDAYLFTVTDDGVFRSSNDTSWTKVNEGLYLPLATGNPQKLIVYGPNIFVGFTNYAGVYYSPNNGAGWISCNVGLPNFSAQAFTSNANYLFVGGQNSGGNGAVWRHPL